MAKKEIYQCRKTCTDPVLMCLYLHVREYIVKYISEIKMYISVTKLRSVYVYILSEVCLFVHSVCIFVQHFEQREILASLQIETFCIFDIGYCLASE